MFQGRYGNDQLNQALSIFGLALIVVQLLLGIFFPGSLAVRLLQLVWVALIVIMLLRMFSRNFEARRRENEMFMRKWAAMQGSSAAGRSRAPRAKTAKHNPTFEERRKYKYFICTQCAQRLRVPRGKGKLRVTCTRCGNKFDIKS